VVAALEDGHVGALLLQAVCRGQAAAGAREGRARGEGGGGGDTGGGGPGERAERTALRIDFCTCTLLQLAMSRAPHARAGNRISQVIFFFFFFFFASSPDACPHNGHSPQGWFQAWPLP